MFSGEAESRLLLSARDKARDETPRFFERRRRHDVGKLRGVVAPVNSEILSRRCYRLEQSAGLYSKGSGSPGRTQIKKNKERHLDSELARWRATGTLRVVRTLIEDAPRRYPAPAAD